jgi:dihydrofolate reductase
MRRVIVCNIASVDGYYAATDNPLALNMDEAFDGYNLERLGRADVVLLGRESFVGFSSYWPFIADAPEDPGNRQYDAINRDISRLWKPVRKLVVSDTLTVPDDNPWRSTTTVVSRTAIRSEIARLREGGDGDILVFASHVLWNALLAEGLVDEIHIVVSPHPLGDGEPLFTAPTRLALIDAEPFPASDNALLRYSPIV